MKVHFDQFHPMRGHAEEGAVIIAKSGKEFTIQNKIGGWMIYGPDNKPCTGYLPTAYDVARFVNSLENH